ncbi:MAG: acetoacetate--CoA ligase [Gammaproteobacteria bacterium]|nr:acetoacetate--CoA ligase [Gammaproteobacteria bacterium]
MKTPKPIWRPSAERVAVSDLSRFATALGFPVPGLPGEGHVAYGELWRWSVAERERFWQDLWNFCGVQAHVKPQAVLADDGLPGARWFPGAKLNYAEHLLRGGSERAPALIARDESGRRMELSREQLRRQVAELAQRLSEDGVGPGDRVAGFLPNAEHAVVAMLATTSLGAIWSSCSPDFGERGVLERFGQIQPKVLIACDGYRYGGKRIDTAARVGAIAAQLQGLKRLVMVPYLDPRPEWPAAAVCFDDYRSRAPLLDFAAVDFNHPLLVMYSSGTTGVPKCIVHGHGGTLLQHLKEHALHGDIRPGERVFFFTTCGWMMWNWLVSALAVGATLVLYDGSPFWPRPGALWLLAAAEGVSHFGTSPKYLSALAKNGYPVGAQHDLAALRTIYSTGSPLAPEQFDYVYATIKADVQLASISGGTDIVSCFALGNPWSPVWRGELQGPGLGLAVNVFDEHGKPLCGKPGELVCTKSFPSMPVAFWNDADGSRYRQAYFQRFPGVWHHGDYALMTTRDTLVIQGRSDATLNPGGVRIGTAEIYRVVEALPEIADAVAVGHLRDGEERVILFVVTRDGHKLDAALDRRIKSAIREQLTPRHLPYRILACPQVPRTLSGKVTEVAVRELIHGRPVRNAAALANPKALEFFRKLGRAQFR